MELGSFSVSLAVKDIAKSKEFYKKLGFETINGEEAQGWLILRNGDHTLGLFQGMFESNILTFNPGWGKDNQQLESFTDVRDIHKELKSQGLEMVEESLAGETGPSSFTLLDPDGNSILIDQHV